MKPLSGFELETSDYDIMHVRVDVITSSTKKINMIREDSQFTYILQQIRQKNHGERMEIVSTITY
jgi:hypothetical protein